MKSIKSNKWCVFFSALPIVLFIVYCVLDYLDVPSLLGLSFSLINVDLFGFFLDATVVVMLYIITYYFVDRRQMQKDANARNMADVLLRNAYKECLTNVHTLEDRNFVQRYVVPKVDGNKIPEENKIICTFQNIPFETRSEILELAKEGYIEKDVLDRYLSIQKQHNRLVNMKIIFSDLVVPQNTAQEQMLQTLSDDSKELTKILNQELARLG